MDRNVDNDVFMYNEVLPIEWLIYLGVANLMLQGDSGGPLAWKNDDGRFELVGLVSWGYDCGDPVYPGVYVDVEFYEAWIDNNMDAKN